MGMHSQLPSDALRHTDDTRHDTSYGTTCTCDMYVPSNALHVRLFQSSSILYGCIMPRLSDTLLLPSWRLPVDDLHGVCPSHRCERNLQQCTRRV
jgi:hypothetical protein